jgi:hypothetical protein
MDRLFGEMGIPRDSEAGRREFERRMERRRCEAEDAQGDDGDVEMDCGTAENGNLDLRREPALSHYEVNLCKYLGLTPFAHAVSASSLTGFELQVIVAVVLGGTRVQGGAGSLPGTFFGVLLIAVLHEGLRGASTWGGQNLPFKISHLEYIFLGLLLVLGVWLNSRPARKTSA